MKKLIQRYKADEYGGFSTMFGITIVMVLTVMGAALEISRLTSVKSKLQSVTDMAVLAGAIAADARDSDREAITLAAYQNNISSLTGEAIFGEPNIVFDDVTQTVTVGVDAELQSILAGFIGKNLTVKAESQSLYAPDSVAPISIAFALDVSGSMNDTTAEGRVKIDTLQDSIAILFEALEAGSRDKDKLVDVLRTGASAYNTELVEDMPMDYGWEDINDDIGRLFADGGTNSVPALENTYAQLLTDREYRIGKGEDISNIVEYAIFMTDGFNNQPEWDDESAAICETMKADGIKLFSIAFAAPETGQALLLDCASGNADTPETYEGKNGDKSDKCMNNGAQGKGNAFGLCSEDDVEDLREAKSEYYHDAEDSDAFKEAFEQIGDSIAQVYIRLI